MVQSRRRRAFPRAAAHLRSFIREIFTKTIVVQRTSRSILIRRLLAIPQLGRYDRLISWSRSAGVWTPVNIANMSAEKRPAGASFGAGQIVKRQRSDNELGMANGAGNGALIQGVRLDYNIATEPAHG